MRSPARSRHALGTTALGALVFTVVIAGVEACSTDGTTPNCLDGTVNCGQLAPVDAATEAAPATSDAQKDTALPDAAAVDGATDAGVGDADAGTG